MIIVLKDADFSDNNLGQIDFPYPISEVTKEYLSHITKYATNSSQARKLDAFINSLIDSGLYNKIKVLCLPAFSSSLSEAFYDLKRNVSIAPASFNIYELRNDGYGIKTSVMPDSSINVDANYIMALNGVLGTGQYSISWGIFGRAQISGDTAFAGLKFSPYFNWDKTGVRIGSYQASQALKINADENHVGSMGLRSFSWDGNNNAHLNFCGLTETSVVKGDSFVTPVDFPSKISPLSFNGYAYNNSFNYGSVAMMFLGNYMTVEELAFLNERANILFDGIL